MNCPAPNYTTRTTDMLQVLLFDIMALDRLRFQQMFSEFSFCQKATLETLHFNAVAQLILIYLYS